MPMRKISFNLVFGLMVSISFIVAVSLSSNGHSMDLIAFKTANNLYNKGKYDEAIQIFENLTAETQSSSALYFNLGNAYHMKGDMGHALLNYRRALRLDPRDQEIRNNIRIMQAENNDLINEAAASRSLIYSIADLTGRIFSFNETAILTLGLWFLIFVLILFFQMSKTYIMRVIVFACLFMSATLFLIVGLSLGSRIIVEEIKPSAVVTAVEIPLSSQLGEAYISDHYLESGAEVFLVDAQGGWVKLSTMGNTEEGWVPAASVELVANTTTSSGL
jgi:hypothetical protein